MRGLLASTRGSCGASTSSSSASSDRAGAVRMRSVAIGGVSEVADRYQAVLLDQFGVLHDGKRVYSPATIEAVQRLHEAKKQVYIISNSSRRSSGTFKKLAKLGFDPAWFAGAVTSGDMAHLHLLERPGAFWQGLGSRCLHLTWSSRGTISLEGLDLQVTSDPLQAQFILAHGTEAVGQADGPAKDMPLEGMKELMQACAARRLPMIVANPDLVTVDGPGKLAVMPGTLAKWYADMGGEVRLMGKPAPVIYEAAMKALAVDPKQVLAIGDSLEHDIAGAAAASIDTLFVAGGIHADELSFSLVKPRASYSLEALDQLGNKFGAQPKFSMGFFEW